MRGFVAPLLQYAFMAWCSVRKAQAQLCLTFYSIIYSVGSSSVGIVTKLFLFINASRCWAHPVSRPVSQGCNDHCARLNTRLNLILGLKCVDVDFHFTYTPPWLGDQSWGVIDVYDSE